MNRLEILDLSVCETVTQNSIEVTGGLSFGDVFSSLFELIKNPVEPDLTGYNITTIGTDPTTVVNKLENPQTGMQGYEVLSNDGKFKSRSLVLLGGSAGTRGSVSLSVSSLNSPLK